MIHSLRQIKPRKRPGSDRDSSPDTDAKRPSKPDVRLNLYTHVAGSRATWETRGYIGQNHAVLTVNVCHKQQLQFEIWYLN